MTKLQIDTAVVQRALDALERGCPPDCKDGMTDSGGVHPWGEAALTPCPSCSALSALRTALQQAEQQAQAGDPEVVAYGVRFANTGKWDTTLIVGIDDTDIADHNSDHLLPLITLQSHREAIAKFYPAAHAWTVEKIGFMEAIDKKDEALKACVEALELMVECSHTMNLHTCAEASQKALQAITKGQEAINV